MRIKAVLIKNKQPEIFYINIDKHNKQIVKAKLMLVFLEIRRILINYKIEQTVRGISIPIDKTIRTRSKIGAKTKKIKTCFQEHLNELVKARKTILNSLHLIKEI